MISLTPDECRVLGVLIEKELTTPDQYPLTLNAVVNGASQKNNRYPVIEYDEDAIFDALSDLRQKGLVVRVDLAGSRAPKYRHETQQKLQISRYELVILAELLLRGPQTIGELRGRASRMHHLDSMEIVKEMLTNLMRKAEPLVQELPPAPGSRAERYAQLLCPDAHPLDAMPAPAESAAGSSTTRSLTDRVDQLESRIEQLESEVAGLREALRKLATALGESDPFPEPENAQQA
ncbi:MAG: YceH family protein [Bacillota bacterium]